MHRFVMKEHSRGLRRRGGFTLIECLVVVSIIGVLVAILLPAVQAARESARRAQCINNLKQIGIGLHSYMSVHSVFPAGQGGRGHSLHVAILPYIEQNALYDSINFDIGMKGNMHNATLEVTRVSNYLCPSDAAIWETVGSSSYAGNAGDHVGFNGFNGVFCGEAVSGRHVSSQDFADGMSGTVALAEWLTTTPNNLDQRRMFFQLQSNEDTFDKDSFTKSCINIGVEASNGNPANTKGLGWFVGLWTKSLYDHAIPINGPNCTLKFKQGFIGGCTAGSLHPGGANVTMGDGHVQFIKDTINGSVWRALGTRSGGEVVGLY